MENGEHRGTHPIPNSAVVGGKKTIAFRMKLMKSSSETSSTLFFNSDKPLPRFREHQESKTFSMEPVFCRWIPISRRQFQYPKGGIRNTRERLFGQIKSWICPFLCYIGIVGQIFHVDFKRTRSDQPKSSRIPVTPGR